MEEKGTMHVHLLTELTGNLYSEESEWEEEWSESDEYGMPLDGTELADYEEVIREELERYGEDDLMQYFDGSESIQEKIQSAVVTIENKDGILYGCTKLELNEFLSQEELQEFTEYITGQYSDGWGEGFEQRDIKVDGGTMNVHFWHPNMEQPKMYEKKTEQIPTKPEKQRPKLQLLGHDGNIFSIMGDASTLLKKNKQTTLAENLKEGQYAVSDDGHLMAYQSEGDKSGGTVIQVMNLSSLETNTVEAASGEKISPLGFVNGDFIYGKMKSEDAGKKASGESITPMYELEIRNSKNKKVASYSFVDKGIYISDILIDDNMVTLNRVEKSGDIYNVTSQEFITNNEERKDTAIKIEVYTTALMEKQMRITFAEGAGEKSVKVIRPNQLASKNELEMVLADNSESVKYYVYGVGELAGIYDKASYAIQKAQKISGVVISSDQKYVWEKGNRDLAYSIEDVALSKEGEETSLEACERYMKTYDAQKVDLTGCTLDQVLYVINRGCPVIALTSADHAILLTGYTKNDITYIDPENGESQTVSISEMEGMVSGSGNTFIGYIK